MQGVTYLWNNDQKRVNTAEPHHNLYMTVDIQGCLLKQISFKSDEGALRYATPKNTEFYVLTDLSATYTLAPSLSHINFKWHSIGLANRIISCIN